MTAEDRVPNITYMSSQPKALKWNANQLKIKAMLDNGASHHQTSKVLGFNISTVVKVANAVKKGQTPATPYIQKTKKKAGFGAGKQNIEQWDTDASPDADGVDQSIGQTSPSNATVAKLFNVSASIPITPIMLAARDYVTRRLNWPPTVPWEDLIDTIFYHYFKSHNPPVILQGWIEAESGDSAPKPGIGTGTSNAGGGINSNDPKTKDMAEAVADALFKKMNRSATLADTNVCIVDWFPNRP